MAIDSYAALQIEIAAWTNRTDLTTRIPTFISMAEARFNRDERLRTRQSVMTDATLIFTGAATAALPIDFGDLININHASTDCKAPLESRTMQELDRLRSTYTAQRPMYYAINGGDLEVAPLPDADYILETTFYRKVQPLTDLDPTNWLLDVAPDIYLMAALVNAWQFVGFPEEAAACETRLQQLLDAYKRDSDNVEAGGAPQQIIGEAIGG